MRKGGAKSRGSLGTPQAPSKAKFHPLFKMDSGIVMTKHVIYIPLGHTTSKCQLMNTCSKQNTELCRDTQLKGNDTHYTPFATHCVSHV